MTNPDRCPLCQDLLDDDDHISPDAARKLLDTPACLHCGGYHEAAACPRIKAATWAGDQPTQTEYWASGQWCRHLIVTRSELLHAIQTEESA